jgi:hypothetical protein
MLVRCSAAGGVVGIAGCCRPTNPGRPLRVCARELPYVFPGAWQGGCRRDGSV